MAYVLLGTMSLNQADLPGPANQTSLTENSATKFRAVWNKVVCPPRQEKRF